MRRIASGVFVLVLIGLTGCAVGHSGQGQGPGRRAQALALTPKQELDLGEQAYKEVLKKNRKAADGPAVAKVREIGRRIAKASEIKPLRREIKVLHRLLPHSLMRSWQMS